ncbi:hypothetical protein SEA_MASHLEY_72 [Microbacterium phage Mashley]|nr:hypothetical protein SEA_MASHLEY_72 [Microbacterium phage Mashley]
MPRKEARRQATTDSDPDVGSATMGTPPTIGRNTMQRFITSTAVAGLLALGLTALAVPASATTVDSFGICVPTEDTTKTIVHPAVGEPTITVPNPDYIPGTPGTPGSPAIGEPTIEIPNPDYVPGVDPIPGTPAIGEPTITVPNPDYVAPTYTPGYWQTIPAVGEPTIIVENPDYVPGTPGTPGSPAVGTPTIIVTNPDYVPAVPDRIEVVHHEAVTHIEYHFAKFTQERTREKGSRGGWGAWSGYGDWVEWSPETHTSWQRSTDPLGSPQFHSSGNYGPNKQWEKQWQARYDGNQRTVEDKAAWDEQVLIPGSPAVGTETIEVTNPDYVPAVPEVPATPAVGEPTIEIDNPDYAPESKVWVDPVYTPAVGEPTVTIDNPDYVPAVPEVPGTPAVGNPTITVTNPGYIPATEGTDPTPAVGEPTMEVENPAYIPERTEVITIPGNECPPVGPEEPEEPTVPEEPVTPEEPVVPAAPVTAAATTPATKAAVASDEDALAQTGGETAIGALALAGGLLLGGTALTLRRRSRRS